MTDDHRPIWEEKTGTDLFSRTPLGTLFNDIEHPAVFRAHQVVLRQRTRQELDSLLHVYTSFLQAPLVEGVAADQVVFEGLRGPDAETGGFGRIHAVADRNDHVQAVVVHAPGNSPTADVRYAVTTTYGCAGSLARCGFEGQGVTPLTLPQRLTRDRCQPHDSVPEGDHMKSVALLAAVLLLAMSCAGTKLSSVWKDPAYHKSPRKIVVLSMVWDPKNRQRIDEAFVREDRKSTRLNSSHTMTSRMPSSA